MIDIQLTGQLPQLNADLESAMEQIADIMFRSVQQNFIAGGRPDQWAPLMPLMAQASHLYQTGNLFESIQIAWGDKSATVFIDTVRVPYAAINNFGGVIKHPGSSKFQVFDYGGGTIFTHGTKPHDIPIPARTFMMFQEEDKTQILQTLSNAIFMTNGEQIQ